MGTRERICNYANITFPTWPHEPEKDPAASKKFSCSHPIQEWFLYFSFIVMWLYITWVRIFDEVLECPLQRKKKRVKCRAGGHGSVRVYVIARFSNSGSFFQSFPYALRRGAGSRPQWGGVRDSEVSTRRELTVYAVLALGICIPFNRYNSPGHASRNFRMS